ncbi:MAG TPA: DEAD/DEAH box helicase, partial [Candidatus Udaeobacter sp.]|nr:DEAD/DEAH box helicase [Candidatus Udaeobacter sp.]
MHAQQLEHERYSIGMRRIAGFLDQGWGPVARYLPADLVTVLESPARLAERAAAQVAEVAAAYEERRRHHELVSPPAVFVSDWATAAGALITGPGFDLEPVRRAGGMAEVLRSIELSPEELAPEVAAITQDAAPAESGVRIRFEVRPQDSFGREMELLRGFLRAQDEAGIRTLVLCDNPGQRDHLRELIGDDAGAAEIAVGRLSGGFLWREVRLCVLTDHEIFGRFRRRRARRRFRAGITLPDLMALKPGDFVVHVDHGIGVYQGTKRLTIGGHETDCLEIQYQRGDKLFIPADQFDLVQKYPVEEGHNAPAVSRLGGTAWARTKEKAKKAIQEMAEELLRLQATRNTRPGFAFSPDTAWQRDLEAAFIYDETPDQERAIVDIKRDMEEGKPMDRLVCGDVGYGKTEVAVRAAFKAVQDRKQVAVLVPTTILAQQHHGTFSERLADFPVQVEVLSRFRTPAEQTAVVAGLKAGEVDIVIGTHRLLQKDVEFRDLGLIVVDEEHRFGVKDKERLKQLKAMSDVLTLTATPIP